MISHRSHLIAALGIALYAAAMGPAQANPWAFFGPPGNTSSFWPVAMNGRSEALAGYSDFGGGTHGLLRAKGTVKTIDMPGSFQTVVAGINGDGDIAGYYAGSSDGRQHGFVRHANGTFETIDVAGADNTYLYGINNRRDVMGMTGTNAGFIRKPDGRVHTFTLRSGITSFSLAAFNGKDEIAGYATDSAQHGFVRDRSGHVTYFDPPGAVQTWVYGMNDGGQVVGVYYLANRSAHGFLRDPDGTFTTLDPSGPGIPPVALSSASGINYAGEIVGTFNDTSGGSHGFVRDAAGNYALLDGDAPGHFSWPSEIGANGKVLGLANQGLFVLTRRGWEKRVH